MTEIPLGQRESKRLEFKGAKALEAKKKIAREVVGMLNALPEGETGEVWIGLTDEQDVASGVEPIESIEEERRKLFDVLVDRIEPDITLEEVDVDVVGDALPVLRVLVRSRNGKRPYCLVSGGQRDFVIRVGARNRPMNREEIFSASARVSDDRKERLRDRTMTARDRWLETGAPRSLWLRLQIEPPIDSLNVQHAEIQELLANPEASGNRRTGWSFRLQEPPRLEPDGVVLETPPDWPRSRRQRLKIETDGSIEFWVDLDRFQHQKGEPQAIWPLTLLEYPVSIARLAAAVWRSRAATDALVSVDFVATGLTGWKIFEEDPRRWGLYRKIYDAEDPLARPRPQILRLGEVLDHPDAMGFQIVRDIYQAFGGKEEWIPSQYDRDHERLILAE